MGYLSNPSILPAQWALWDGDLSVGGNGAGVANTVYLVDVVLFAPAVLTGVRVRFASGGAGHYDVGIYDSGGNLLSHAASSNTALVTSTGSLTPALIGGNVTLNTPGKYQLAVWVDNATDTMYRALGGGGASMMIAQAGGSTGPLPANTSSLTGLANGTLRPVLIGLLQGGWS
jgi:hypothetical protein